MKNLVLGFGTNQSAADCRVFVNSLRQVYSPAECDGVLIVDRPPAGVDTSGPNAITFVTTENSYPHRSTVERKAKSLFIRTASVVAAAGPAAIAKPAKGALHHAMERWHHPHFARWLAYRRFLEAHPEHDQVLLTDVRDVMFQRAFFAERTDAVQLFEQDTTYGTGNCDSDWYRQAWGDAALARAAGKPALCIGTILGPRAEVLKLVTDFIDYFAAAPFRGVEQAVFNRMMIEGEPRFRYAINANVEGLVATLANPASAAAMTVVDGRLTRSDGSIVPIVHMYDRFDHTDAVAQAFA